MTPSLGDFDQSTKLLVVRAGFNLKFYFNFLQMPFFIGSRMNRRSSERYFPHACRNSERHQDASAQRAEERRYRIGRRRILTGQPPSKRAVRHFGIE